MRKSSGFFVQGLTLTSYCCYVLKKATHLLSLEAAKIAKPKGGNSQMIKLIPKLVDSGPFLSGKSEGKGKEIRVSPELELVHI